MVKNVSEHESHACEPTDDPAFSKGDFEFHADRNIMNGIDFEGSREEGCRKSY
jgi:hypothetical protein